MNTIQQFFNSTRLEEVSLYDGLFDEAPDGKLSLYNETHSGSYHRRRLEILSEFIKQMNFGDCVDVFLSGNHATSRLEKWPYRTPCCLLTTVLLLSLVPTTLRLTILLMSYHLFPLPIIFLCCLHLPYVYRESLESASIDRVLILDPPVRHICIMEGDLDLSLLWSLCGGIFWVMQ
jgi:hypothetical protein